MHVTYVMWRNTRLARTCGGTLNLQQAELVSNTLDSLKHLLVGTDHLVDHEMHAEVPAGRTLYLQAQGVSIHFSCKGLGGLKVQGEAAQLGVPAEPGWHRVGRKQL